jgi:hypothetical protein
MLQEQADGFMAEEVTDVDDYADWIRWVSDAKQSRQDMCESTHYAPIPLLLQQPNRNHDSSIPALLYTVQIKDGNSDCKPLSNWHHPAIMKWTLGGEKFASGSRLTPHWMRRDSNNSGEFWSGTKTFLLGTRAS